MQSLSSQPQNVSGFLNNAFSYLFWLLPCYFCAPRLGNNGRLMACDSPGTSVDLRTHEGMWKALLSSIKVRHGLKPRFLIFVLTRSLSCSEHWVSVPIHVGGRLIFLRECCLRAELPVSPFPHVHNTVYTQIHSGHLGPGYWKVA